MPMWCNWCPGTPCATAIGSGAKKTGLVVEVADDRRLGAGSGAVGLLTGTSSDAPVKMDQLARMMAGTSGYRVEKAGR